MDKRKKLKHLLWNRGPVGEILSLALSIYREEMYGDRESDPDNKTPDPVGALVGLASVYYTLAKRLPLGAWYLYRAITCADNAHKLSLPSPGNKGSALTPDQVDVITRIWSFAPSRRRRKLAIEMLKSLLWCEDEDSMSPHARVLTYITLGALSRKEGDKVTEKICFTLARQNISAVRREELADRDMQLVRILFAVGCYEFDNAKWVKEKREAEDMLYEAYELAVRVAKDQVRKIRWAAWRRGIHLSLEE